MSSFGMFESDEAAQDQPRLAAKTAAVKLEAAIDAVRSSFGRFLLGATGVDEFNDRWHYSKNDVRKTIEPYVFPNTGTMRRVQNAMKADWKLAHPYKLALEEGETPTGGPLEGPMDLGYRDDDRWGPATEEDLDMDMLDKVHRQYHDDPFRKLGPELDPAAGHAGFGEFSHLGPDGWDYDAINRMTDSRQEYERNRTSRRLYAEDRDAPIQDIDETYSPSDDLLIPEGDFEGYKNSVDQGAPSKVQRDFTPGGDSGRHEAARLVADIYTDFARSNGLRVASLDTLDAYASTGIADADYRLLQSMIVRTAGDDCECDEDEDEDEDDETEESEPSESESDESPEESGEEESGEDEDYSGGEDEGGQTYTVPDEAPELDPQLMQEIPQDDPQGSAPVPPEVIDSLLGLPEGTIEQLLLEEVEQGAGDEGSYGGPPPEEGDGSPFGDEEPRTARRRRQAGIPDRKGPWTDIVYAQGDDYNEMADMGPEEMFHHLTQWDYGDDDNVRDEAPWGTNDRLHTFNDGNLEYVLSEGDGGAGLVRRPMNYRNASRRRQAADNYINRADLEEYLGRTLPYEDLERADLPGLAERYLRHSPHVIGDHPDRYDRDEFDGPRYPGPNWKDQWLDANGPSEDEYSQMLQEHFGQRDAARRFWAAEDEDPSGGGQEAPPQDPSAGGGGMDPSMMGGGGMMPPPGSQAVAPPAAPQQLENQPAEDALLDTANQAIMQMIDQETAEYQQIIDPLSQALQAIQFAQQVEQSEHPMDVTPPQGTVDVSPAAAPGGQAPQQPMQQQAMRRRADKGTGPGKECGTPGCTNEARWIPISEGNKGSRTYRCTKHCDEAALKEAKVDVALRNAAALIASRYRLSATGHQMLLEATLGRRGYEHVVEALKLVPMEVRKAAAIHMSHLFAAGNQRFNKDVFMKTVMASNPRDRAWDAWASGRDRGVAEHGRHDLEDDGDDYEGPHYREFDGYEASRRSPKKARGAKAPRRQAGETWVPTPILDPYEHQGAGEVPRVDDGNPTNDLPKMPGAEPNRPGRQAASASDALSRFQRWMQYKQQSGVPVPGGEGAIHNFLQTRRPGKAKVGPDATNALHRSQGLEPDAVRAPKAKPVKAVNPSLTKPKAPAKAPAKTASFFTRKVPGWRFDDHLNGYISKEGRAFTCSCGESIDVPSYTNCKCGKVWNSTAIGDSHHLASDTADMYVVREIAVRPGVVMANKKLAGYEDDERFDCLHDDVSEYVRLGFDHNDPYYHDIARRMIRENYLPHHKWMDEAGNFLKPAPVRDMVNDWQPLDLDHPDFEGHDWGKQAACSYRERLADWTKYDDEDPSRQGGPKKPPSTEIKSQPSDWTDREFTGPNKGQWRDPQATELPRKTRKRK